ncbi:hypothetical protein [Roseibium aggregatum]|uniref:Uncharacterized protein n=1 Tax=Roseibium aggregatum TaxID=187304 RepID=A0A939EFS3_9HYPH|nr:hypothetical protein [Roseibium aggregatum]MBN9671363.1 hypothetical protein [Roseibium aggregatum]
MGSDYFQQAADAAGKAFTDLGDTLEKKALSTLQSKNADGIPAHPLANMANAHLRKDKSSAALLQAAIDHLTAKAKTSAAFTAEDKAFMKSLYESFWYGGTYKGYYEAAILANHYVNGGGARLFINADCYIGSVIVRDTMAAMVDYLKSKGIPATGHIELVSSNPQFLGSSAASGLKRKGRKLNSQGYILPEGALLTEQDNLRLKNADHRFFLKVTARKTGRIQSLKDTLTGLNNSWNSGLQGNIHAALGIGATETSIEKLKTLNDDYALYWSVESLYDFEPFPKPYYTNLPIAQGVVLKLPDGLSHYLTKVGVAKDFHYYSEW